MHLSLAVERLKEKLGIAVEPFTLRKNKHVYTLLRVQVISHVYLDVLLASRCQEQRRSECRQLTLTLALRAVWVSTGGIDKSRPPNVFKPSRYRGRLACLSKAFVGVDIKETCKWSLTNRSDSNSETPERRRNDPAKASSKRTPCDCEEQTLAPHQRLDRLRGRHFCPARGVMSTAFQGSSLRLPWAF